MTTASRPGDKPVNRIGFGAMPLAGAGVFGPPRDPDAARAVLRRLHVGSPGQHLRPAGQRTR
jgi:hypothetical protein